MTSKTGLFWFRQDLRVYDNEALNQLARKVDYLICVYVIDQSLFTPDHYQSSRMGTHRWRFISESLQDLNNQLSVRRQCLIIRQGDPVEEISKLIKQYKITDIACNYHSGIYERQEWASIQQAFPNVNAAHRENHSLFAHEQLPFSLGDLPSSFTPFRKKVEKLSIDRPSRALDIYPSPPDEMDLSGADNIPDVMPADTGSNFEGGSQQALHQIDYYFFQTGLLSNYKATRNGLDGWDFSSKLSAWLANGSLSVRHLFHEIKRFEAEHGANESTYWLYFELLWREYFYWYALKHGRRLFSYSGIKRVKPLTTFSPQRFAKWCAGNTPYPIVNACMHQLNATGFMSNRGRQLVASCFVHELALDWRYGAAYFEQQLIDYDVGSNWGNWQYLSGVGADPRGHRQFDLDKQTRIYDPQQKFIAKWRGDMGNLPLDDVDCADWPIQWQ